MALQQRKVKKMSGTLLRTVQFHACMAHAVISTALVSMF